MQSSRRPTQLDVARAAGVSQATVSLVLSGSPHPRTRVSDASRQRVLEAAERLGYAPNPLAQGLVRGRSRVLGVFTYESVFPKDGSSFYHPLLVGLESAAEDIAVDLLLFTSAPLVARRRRLVDTGWNRVHIADGCVLIGRMGDAVEAATLAAQRYPFVHIGRRESSSSISQVSADYVHATEDVVHRLYGLGHRRIALLGDLGGAVSAVDRLNGYRSALQELGQRPILLDAAAFTPDEAIEVLDGHGATAVLLSTVVTSPDELTLAAQRAGKRVPDDLSLAVLGESEVSPAIGDHWSGFTIPRVEMGDAALRLLDQIVRGVVDAPSEQLLPCTMVEGSTVASAS
ncbi:LacI family DNA-binding transcriptional regulator [Microlunatus sp. Y2014]|uniref:LacI family DNA-binding transcriptional regulator n=1 Tax=Microlunatus sp. Y2014 TaxID=3418488 RepID=UPI003DA73FD8